MRGVGVHLLGDRAPRRPGEAAVEPAGGAPLVAEQLAEEPPVLDAQVGPVDVVLGEAGQRGDPLHRGGALLAGQPVAAREHPRVVAGGVLLGLGQHALERPAAELAVVVRDRGVGGEVERVGAVVALVLEVDRGDVEDAGDQDQPVDVHPVPGLQVLDQRGAAERAVGLAGDELRRHPALVPRGPDADDLADRLDVALVAVERLRLGALHRARVAGRHRVDEDQVGHGEQRLGVVGQAVRRGQQLADVAHDDPARPEQAEVQPHRRRAGAAVEGERHRARRGPVGGVHGVGGDRHLRLGLEALERAVLVDLVAQHDAAGGRGVVERPAADLELVLGGHQVVDRVGRLGRPAVLAGGRGGVSLLLVGHRATLATWPPGLMGGSSVGEERYRWAVLRVRA